jgi:two-component system nitrogen regulation response regulator GlnG
LFLDEVGDMTPPTQAKILRVLQDQRFERIGGEETIATEVRLIAATNADLPQMVEEGHFRRDLYFRLNVFQIDLPPLRDRGDDLDLLIQHYLTTFGQELGKSALEVPTETMAALHAYRWPGNVRELQSVLKQALLQMPGSVLLPKCLPPVVRGNGTTEQVPSPAGLDDWNQFISERLAAGTQDLYAEALQRLERDLLIRVLRHTAGNQVQAARILGITRGSLRTKIRALGISIGRSVWSDNEQGDS